MLNKITFSILSLALVAQLSAQTESFSISWDLNTEEDIFNYQIYRSTSPGASNEIASVQHPGNEYKDVNIQKGVRYYYRLTATDYSANRSSFSSEVSAAIPLISGLQSEMTLAANETVVLQLDNYVSDPDHSDTNISWVISGNSSISVNVSNRVATIIAPQNWAGQEQLIFTAEDPHGFSDVFTMTIVAEDNNPQNPPVFATIPAQQLNEDTQATIDLADFVSDDDSDISNLQFSVQNVASIALSIEENVLTINPSANWSGSRQVNVTVRDESNNTDQISFTVTVNPVNDAPVLSQLPSQVIRQDTTIIVGLGSYVTDVDNDIADLSWQFTNNDIVSLSFNDANDELTISAVGSPAGFDDIIVTVLDPDNASASDTLTVRVTSTEIYPPQIVNLPDVIFDEDGMSQIALNNFVTDSDDPIENLFWYTGTDENVSVSINQTTNVATISARENWYGQTNLWFIVKDPDQNMATEQISITVIPVNDRPNIDPLPSVNLSQQLSKQMNLATFTNDVDNDLSSLSWTAGSSENVSVNITENGLATFIVEENWLGQERVQIFVSDENGARDTSETTVYRQNQEFAPQITSIGTFTIAEDSQSVINLNNYISDPDNSLDQLQINYSNNNNIDISIDESTNEMTLVPDANWFGTEYIYLEVLDPSNNVAFDTITAIIIPSNDAPALMRIGNLTLLENTTSTIDLSEYIIDVDGLDDITEISLLGSNNSFFGYYLDDINCQLTFFAPAGFYGRETYLLKIKDSYAMEASTVFTISVLEKNIAGAISVNYFGGETNLNMSWNTYKETKDYIEYGTTSQYGLSSDIEDTYAKDHNHLLSGLAEHTNYHFRIVSESTDGNKTFSADSVFSTGANSGNTVNVFPIPYQQSEDIDGNGISFTNLPANAKLNIYNLLGEPVYKRDELSMTYRWNVENNAGRKLSSGLYMYVINSENNKKITSGKLIIVR